MWPGLRLYRELNYCYSSLYHEWLPTVFLLTMSLDIVSLKVGLQRSITVNISTITVMKCVPSGVLPNRKWKCPPVRKLFLFFIRHTNLHAGIKLSRFPHLLFSIYNLNAPYIIWSLLMAVALNRIYAYTVCVCRNTMPGN